MTREEIIQMAKPFLWGGNVVEGWTFSSYEQLETFDKLVAEKAIKEALAQPGQEPVAYLSYKRQRLNIELKPQTFVEIPTATDWEMPLYMKPPQREFVGLTYEEETELIRLAHNHAGIRFYIQAAEAKLKEKNT